jgi:hypothetical protein
MLRGELQTMEYITVIFFVAQLAALLVGIVKYQQNHRWGYTTRQLLIAMTLIAAAVAAAAGLARWTGTYG